MFRNLRPAAAAVLTLFLALACSLAVPAHAAPPFATDAVALKAIVPDADVESLPGGFAVTVPKPYAAPAAAKDPRYGWRFARALYVYAPVRPGESAAYVRTAGLGLVASVHYQPDDEPRARQTGRLIARLLRLHRERFGRPATFPRDAATVDVWLAPETPKGALEAGGETRDNQLYVFAIDAGRSPIEWVRTVAHEWGHLTLPAARGYAAPEFDAAGYLGERLYIKWLREDASAAAAPIDDGVTKDGLDLYWERQIGPLMDEFAAAGPNAKLLAGDGEDAMDLYVGGVLSSDAAFGSALTGRALRRIEGVRARDFFASLRQTVSEATASGESLPVRLPAWVPLERGRYVVSGGAPLAVAAPTWRFLKTPAQATLRRASTAAPKREASAR